jgi:hypothetical protein
VIAAYCAYNQALALRRRDGSLLKTAVPVVILNLALPLIYFGTIAYPATSAAGPYSVTGLRFVHGNFEYYKTLIAPTTPLKVAYAAIVVAALLGALAAVRRRDFFPIAVLGSAVATGIPSLVQGQQRYVYYLAMPLLLLFSALIAGARPVLAGTAPRLRQIRAVSLVALAVALILIFAQGADVRSYFISTPYGGSLAAFRSQVAELTAPDSAICTTLNMAQDQQQLLEAELSGPDGFLVPPVSAATVAFVSPGEACPPGFNAAITVNIDPRLDWVASPTPPAPVVHKRVPSRRQSKRH